MENQKTVCLLRNLQYGRNINRPLNKSRQTSSTHFDRVHLHILHKQELKIQIGVDSWLAWILSPHSSHYRKMLPLGLLHKQLIWHSLCACIYSESKNAVQGYVVMVGLLHRITIVRLSILCTYHVVVQVPCTQLQHPGRPSWCHTLLF